MKKLLIASALGMLVTAPALAQQNSTMDQVLKELAALNERIEQAGAGQQPAAD